MQYFMLFQAVPAKALVFIHGSFEYNEDHTVFGIFAYIHECYNELCHSRQSAEYQ